MKHPRILLSGVAALSLATAVFAQNEAPGRNSPPQGEGGPGNRPPVAPLIAAIDTNKDGILSAAEIANSPAALKGLDKNGDGALGPEDIRPPQPEGGGAQEGGPAPRQGQERRQGPPQGQGNDQKQGPTPPAGGNNGGARPAPGLFGQLDTNQDRSLSAAEINAAPAALAKLDKNGDGAVTRDELAPARPRAGGQNSGQNGGPNGNQGGNQNRPDRNGPPPPPEDGQ